MKKEQVTIRFLPLTKLNLERHLEKSKHKNMNDFINFIVESYLFKENQEEKITDSVKEIFKEMEENLMKELKSTKIELEWNKKLLAKLCSASNVSSEQNKV